MTNQTSLTDELTGNSSTIQTDHGDLEFGDLIVLLLDLVLLIYTGWRSYDFLSTTVPSGFQILALVGLWGLDIGAVAWSLVWVFGSTEKYQDWTSLGFFIIDLLGVVTTSLTDSLMYGDKGGTVTSALTGIAVVVIPLVVVGNVVAGFVYHLTSPATRARREARKELARHRRNMEQVAKMNTDLVHAEAYLLAKQDTLEKAAILAQIKIAQDGLEKLTRTQLRDPNGIYGGSLSSPGFSAPSAASSVIEQMKARLEELRQKLTAITNPHDASADSAASSISTDLQPASTPVPASSTPQSANPPLPAQEPMIISSNENTQTGPAPEIVNGNGHSNTDPL